MKRRVFLSSTIAAAAALSMSSSLAWSSIAGADPRILRVVRRTIEVNGRAASVFGLEEGGKSGIRLRATEPFKVLLKNETAEPTLVHWHGLTPPWQSDGVPDAPMPTIGAGAKRTYNFPLGRPGTYWMHAHSLQEQTLLAAPLIVEDPADAGRDEQEVVVLLHDFSFSTPEQLLQGLRTAGGYVGNRPAMASGAGSKLMNRGATAMDHGGMAMGGMSAGGSAASDAGNMARDLNDIDYDAYLANDRTLDDPEVFSVEQGGRVRVRIINGATATAFTLDFGELAGTLIAVDGQPVEPIRARRLPLSMGQRIDVRLELPRGARAFPVLALREGAREQTGFILQSKGAEIAKLQSIGDQNGPVLDLGLETRLRAGSPLSPRSADKAFDLSLVGDMATYQWGLQTPAPITVDRGDRVEVTLRNTSAMAHPMHLHGHHFQVVAVDGARFAGAVRDTVLVTPQRSLTIAVDADNVGQWAFHCHHLYHMAEGMMTTFAYRD